MPLTSTLTNPHSVFTIKYSLPDKATLMEALGASRDGDNFTRLREGTLQMVFCFKYNIKCPSENISDPLVVNSQAYRALTRSFYELVKNSIDAEASSLWLAIFTGGVGEVEIVVADQGKGFCAGKYASYFKAADERLVQFQELAHGASRLDSDKQRGFSLGGAGKAWALLSNDLRKGSGDLWLQTTSEYSAILRLKSLVGVNDKCYTVPSEGRIRLHSPVAEVKENLSQSDGGKKEDEKIFSTAAMLTRFDLAAIKKKKKTCAATLPAAFKPSAPSSIKASSELQLPAERLFCPGPRYGALFPAAGPAQDLKVRPKTGDFTAGGMAPMAFPLQPLTCMTRSKSF